MVQAMTTGSVALSCALALIVFSVCMITYVGITLKNRQNDEHNKHQLK